MLGGIQHCSFIDFPGHIAAVLFTQGCNLRCSYCHNPQLIPVSGELTVSTDAAMEFLETRRGMLTGVVLTGGEPCIHSSIPDLMNAVRSMGFLLKLDTNGTYPVIISKLVLEKLVDFVAVDIKIAPGPESHRLCGMEEQAELAVETLSHCVNAGIRCEARTTVVDGVHDRKGLELLARKLGVAGVRNWRLQPVRNERTFDTSRSFAPPAPDILSEAIAAAAALGIAASVRS